MTTEIPAASPSVLSGNDKLWSVLSHLSGFFAAPFLFPLVVYLVMRDDSPYVAEHAKEALNFHISLFIYTLIAIPFCAILIGFALLFALWAIGLIFAIVAAVKSTEGVVYRYPVTLRLIG